MESNFSDVGICNSAILKVGAEEISSFNDGTRTSNTCALLYPILRDEVVRSAPWRFALQQYTFSTPSGNVPLYNYQAAYDIPDEILRVWQVQLDSWTVMGNQVFCNKTDGIDVLAIIQVTDPTAWDAQFAEALAWRMASEIALSLVQSVPLQQEMVKGYEKCMALARSTNAVVGTSDQLIIDVWSQARKYGFGKFAVTAGPPEPYGP